MVMPGILSVIYVIIGAVVAQQHHFFTHLNTLSEIVSVVLAISLWPLILFGANLHVHL
jgi:hypothetical protein